MAVPRKPKYTEATVRAALELVNKGMSWREAAERFGMRQMRLRERVRLAPSGMYEFRRGARRAISPQKIALPTSETDRAYLAGLVDGEGYITISGADGGTNRRAVRVGVTNTHWPTIDWLVSMGGSARKQTPSNAVRSNKPCWTWSITGRLDVLAFLNALVPYMRIKRDKAEKAIATLEDWTEGVAQTLGTW